MTPFERARTLVAAAGRLADARDPLGRRSRAVLPASTGLSIENVELALGEILETRASDREIEQLCASVAPAPRAHVLLSANVFTAPLRAIALALAQSARVEVRPSRREPELCLLLREAGGDFEIVETLDPKPGDHVWIYGGDDAIREVTLAFPAGVFVHRHGPGIGVALVEGDLERAARALTDDVVPFDQRGCLSPRVAFVLGGSARDFAEILACALNDAERRIPLGTLGSDEAADVARWRDSALMVGEVLRAGRGWVAHDDSTSRWIVPPVGRNVCVVPAGNWASRVSALSESIAAVGVQGGSELRHAARRALPHARMSDLGRMQRPPLDGAVDRRPATRAVTLVP